MRRVIGMDIHRTFGEVAMWQEGRLQPAGRVEMTRTALEGLGKGLLGTDDVVIEATGNAMAVQRVLSPFVAKVVIANPIQVKAIAHAHVKTDKVDAGTLAMRQVTCQRSGRLMRGRSGYGDGSPGGTRLSGIGRGSRTRCIRSFTLI